jgi:hypothetical protein
MESTVVPMMGTPASLKPRARFSGVCPPNWTMTPFTSPPRRGGRAAKWAAVEALADVEDVFVREGLEEEQVAGVVVGADGLGVRVDHHRLDAQLAHRERGLHAAVVELDPLPDAVGAAADDDDLWGGR